MLSIISDLISVNIASILKIKPMKKILILIVLASFTTYAGPTPPPPGLPPPAVTIDREVELLLAAGVFLGVYWIRKTRR